MANSGIRAGGQALTIDEVISRIPGWTGATIAVSALGGGITNLNYRVDVGGKSFVVRMPGKDSELLGIDRRREYACTLVAGEGGVGPEVSQFLESKGILITHFSFCPVWSWVETSDPRALMSATAAVSRYDAG